MADSARSEVRFDLAQTSPTAAAHLLNSIVVPRPIAWVSTVDANGRSNLAPHSYFMMLSTNPPVLMFASTGVKDTLSNVRVTDEFVVNLVNRSFLEHMVLSGTEFPASESEFEWAGLATIPSTKVKPRRVDGAPAALECKVRDIVHIGDAHVVFGDVLLVHIDSRIWKNDRIDPGAFDAVGRLGGSAYTVVDTVLNVRRQTWEQVRASGPAPSGREP